MLKPMVLALVFLGMTACGVEEDSSLSTQASCNLPASLVQNGAAHVLVNVGSGKALDVPKFNRADGVQLIMFPLNNGTNQRFVLRPTGNFHTLMAQHSGKFVDVKAASKAAGASVQQFVGNGGQNQQWQLVNTGNGRYKIVSRNSNLSLSVANNSNQTGALLVQSADTNNAFQRWMIIPAANLKACHLKK